MSNVKLDESQNTENTPQIIKKETLKTECQIDEETKQVEDNNNKIFKPKDKNELLVDRIKSEDTSLEFEEVSSLSSFKCSDFTISSIESYDDDDVENIVVCVGNELAFQNYKDAKMEENEKTDGKKPESYKDLNRSQDRIKYSEKNSRSRIIDRNEHKGRRRSEEDHRSRYTTPPRRGGSRGRYSPSRYRRSRSCDRSRSRYLSNRNRRSRSFERSRRYRNSRSPSYRVRRRRRTRSRSRSRSNSYRSPRLGSEKRSSFTKKRKLSHSPVRSIWKLLDCTKPVTRPLAKSPQPPKTPPLPKSPPPPKPPSPVEQPLIPPPPPPQLTINNVTNVVSSSYPWAQQENHPQNVYQFQNSSMPRVSINNLPLVPGFGNLPVHITMTGEQILHDMEGRPIPIGPNGLLLPLDLSGRLYPHVVFPYNNQAFPIYMSEDGVLRLPNGEPVPYGPPNQLPVNIDGSVIPIGPDSRPLYPCPNVPRHNPMITPTVTNPPPPPPPQRIQPQIQQININTGGVQKLGKLPPSVIQIKTVPDVKLKMESKSGEFKPVVSVKIQKKKLFEDIDLPELVLNFSERVKSINISAIYQKKLRGAKVTGDVGKGDTGEKNSTIDNQISQEEKDLEKKYIETIQEAISFFTDIDFKPPLFGRFLFAESPENFKIRTHTPNQSPLLTNKIRLPFLIPENPQPKSKRPSIGFRFLPPKLGGKPPETARVSSIGIQCDFTSRTFKILQSKIEKLKRELFRSRNENAELTDLYNSLREESQKKTEELMKVLKKMEGQNKTIKDLNQQRK